MKDVFFEPPEMKKFEETLAKFKRAANDKTRGAIYFGVMGGLMSEGTDIEGNLVRGVIICGVPFANISEPFI